MEQKSTIKDRSKALAVPSRARGTRKPKAAKIIELKVWKVLTEADCIKSMRTASHLASKSVNSNAAAVGVRIASDARVDLPYVAVSTLGADTVPVDYILGATDAGPFRQTTSVLAGEHALVYANVPPAQVTMIQGLRNHMQSSAQIGIGLVDPRLRQILMPGDSSRPWVALTPLQSSGLSDVIQKRLRIEADSSVNPSSGKSSIFRSKAHFGIGGSKSLNVGQHAKSMQRPLVFLGPTEDKDLRAAYAIHFRGHLRDGRLAPYQETLAFARWRHDLTKGNLHKMPTDMGIRQTEADHIRAIAAAASNAACAARDMLQRHAEILDGLTSEDLEPFLRQLIDPALRDRDFKKTFAWNLIRSIERFKFKVGQGEHVVGGDGDLASLISVAEEVAL